MTRFTQWSIGAGVLTVIGVGCVLVLGYPPTPARPVDSVLCTAAPTTTAIGAVRFPIASRYEHLRGLGMLFTAADCGEARFAAVATELQYDLVGGKILFKNVPTQAAHDVLTSLGFQCFDPDIACTEWHMDGVATPKDLLQLKPFVDEMRREDCDKCG